MGNPDAMLRREDLLRGVRPLLIKSLI
jgi:hypothetical protein